MREIHNNHNVCMMSAQLVLVCHRRKPLLIPGTTEIIEKAFAIVGAKHDCQLDPGEITDDPRNDRRYQTI